MSANVPKDFLVNSDLFLQLIQTELNLTFCIQEKTAKNLICVRHRLVRTVELVQYYQMVTNLNAFAHLDLKEQLAMKMLKNVLTILASMEELV